MKKLILGFAAVALSTVMFAQTEKKTETKSSENKMTTHCYAMKDGTMKHCMGSKAEPMTKDATLKNGTMVSTTGEVTMKDGKKTMLSNGQCITADGKIQDFDKAHSGMMKHDDNKK